MQEQSPITQLPPHVIRNITGFIVERHDRSALAGTCRYLNDSVATDNKSLGVYCGGKRGTLPVSEFLDQVFAFIQHVVARQGNNLISLYLDSSDLGNNMKAVSSFLKKCSNPPIVRHLVFIDLDANKFNSLPKEIKGLTYLESLSLGYNVLGKKDLILLEKIINESLKRLEAINIDENKLLSPHDIYQTIAHCALKCITAYHLEGWHDFEPTPEELKAQKAVAILV